MMLIIELIMLKINKVLTTINNNKKEICINNGAFVVDDNVDDDDDDSVVVVVVVVMTILMNSTTHIIYGNVQLHSGHHGALDRASDSSPDNCRFETHPVVSMNR